MENSAAMVNLVQMENLVMIVSMNLAALKNYVTIVQVTMKTNIGNEATVQDLIVQMKMKVKIDGHVHPMLKRQGMIFVLLIFYFLS